MKAFSSDETEDQMGKNAPNLSIWPHLLEDMAQVMMHQVSWMGRVLTGPCAKLLTAPVLLERFGDQYLKRKAKPAPLSELLSLSP